MICGITDCAVLRGEYLRGRIARPMTDAETFMTSRVADGADAPCAPSGDGDETSGSGDGITGLTTRAPQGDGLRSLTGTALPEA